MYLAPSYRRMSPLLAATMGLAEMCVARGIIATKHYLILSEPGHTGLVGPKY